MGTRVLEPPTTTSPRSSSPRPTSTTSSSTSRRSGWSNDGEVFIAADRPYGLIEATVPRDDAPDPGDAWLAVPAFA